VSRNHVWEVDRQVAFHNVKIGSAHSAGVNCYADLIVAWSGRFLLDEMERVGVEWPRSCQFPGPHPLCRRMSPSGIRAPLGPPRAASERPHARRAADEGSVMSWIFETATLTMFFIASMV
jgi:hypothetical protein